MKKCLTGVFIFLFVAAFSSACEVFAQETYDFDGSIQVKVGRKKIKEDVAGIVDITMTEEEEEEFIKKGNTKSSHEDSGGGSTFEEATLSFEFETDDTECGDTLEEETVEVDVNPQDGGGGSKRNVRVEFDDRCYCKNSGKEWSNCTGSIGFRRLFFYNGWW